MFMTAALIGIRIEWKTAASNMNDSRITSAITKGSLDDRWVAESTLAAVSPPTSTSTPLPATAAGITLSRRVLTSATVLAADGAVDGVAMITAAVRCGLI